MRPISRAVERALRALGVEREVGRADAVRAWAESAASVFGDDADRTHAIRADGDTLVVVVPTAQWAGEIRLRERDLVAAVLRRAPSSGIAHVRPVPGAALGR